jgi:exoribonuclease II
MSDTMTVQGSLVLYKNRPARVAHTGEKLEIELEDGKTLKVRPKDIVLLHPGPLRSLGELEEPPGDVETAWELLAGSTTSLVELSELIYGDYTPAAAWAAWQLVTAGLYFHGTPETVQVSSAEEVVRVQAAREARLAEEQAWMTFLEHLRVGNITSEDHRYLKEVEELALGRRTNSRVLRELGRSENPEKAHALLLKLGYWDSTVDPYPQRCNVATVSPAVTLPALPEERRRDLTHLAAFAIDDEGSHDPDDAISLEGSRLWVHVADVAALVPPESSADLEARARGANLYLPEGTVPMLPPEATQLLGLGLTEISPALSFGMDLTPAGEITGIEIVPSWIRATRLTYDEVELRLAEEPFTCLYDLVLRCEARRQARGAITLTFPEIKLAVQDGQVTLRPLPPLRSRSLVQEAMLMAGEAVARYALARDVPFPFATQEPPEAGEFPEGLAGMYARRRTLKRSQQTTAPAPHAGLGLEVYARATSPLRRYLDLVVHQQLRAHLRGAPLLEEPQILGRVGAAEAVTANTRQAEFLAYKHWTLVYLMQHPDWRGEGIVVDKRDHRAMILIPALGLELRLHLEQDVPLNSAVPLMLRGINLAELDAHFQIAF